jgi:hypothetical protein
MPKELESGVLYVSKEFSTAAHVCPCGCGSKVRTPLGPTDWQLDEGAGGPTLYPSIGNWQQPCKSHYWIENGTIEWAEPWSKERVERSRQGQDDRSRRYYAELRSKGGVLSRLWRALKNNFLGK